MSKIEAIAPPFRPPGKIRGRMGEIAEWEVPVHCMYG